MQFHQFTTATLLSTAWKNGRGATREIVAWPPGSDLGSFCWRVSIATIGASAPFSSFEGVDRTIMLLSGPGVHLRSAEGRVDHRLNQAWQPFSFPGDVAMECEVLGSEESSDFNVMTRRPSYRSETRVLRARAPLEPARFGLVLGLRGTWQVGAAPAQYRITPGAGLWWESGAPSKGPLLANSVGGDDSALIYVRMA